MILAAQSEAFKQENVLAERLRGLDQQMERKGDERFKEWNSGDDQLRLRWMIYLVVLADAAESVRDPIGFEYYLASSSGWTNSPILWAEIGESSLTGLELVQETTDKVELVKEKPKAARDCQKSGVDYRRKSLEFEVGDRVLLKVTPCKGVVRFGKKDKLAPRYVGSFEILERIGLVAYRLRLPEELNSVHDTFHVLNLKKCLADANLHVPLDEIKIAPVKVGGNSKRGPEFTWEHEDQMRIKLVIPLEMAKSSFGLLAGIHGLFYGRYCGLDRKVTCGFPWPGLEGNHRTSLGIPPNLDDWDATLLQSFDCPVHNLYRFLDEM
ncbi:hypothetical protein Tco_1517731 [Tanacetum coccineum]